MIKEVHEGLVVIGVHYGNVGVRASQLVDCCLKLLVVVAGEGVEALQALPLVVGIGICGVEHREIAWGAPYGEVPRYH